MQEGSRRCGEDDERGAGTTTAAGPTKGEGPRRVALITGITGQDGSYLAELLIGKGYAVHGIVRRSSSFNTGRLEHLYEAPDAPSPDGTDRRRLVLHYGDLSDGASLRGLLADVRPDEIYNLGAQSHVKVSFELPEYTGDVTGLGALRLLEAVRAAYRGADVATWPRVYQASSSELFGAVAETPQRETTPFHPRSPYGVAKAFAYWTAVNYREAYGMHVSNGILFNHESPRRGRTFVTRKITEAVARIAVGRQCDLRLGNVDARRDWGHARDYVEAMWRILQRDEPDDYVVATGETHSVREFVERAFAHVGITIAWRGTGLDEVGVDAAGRVLVRVDPQYMRPAEVDLLLGDASKAERLLGWRPTIAFDQLVHEMVDADLAAVRATAAAEAGDFRGSVRERP